MESFIQIELSWNHESGKHELVLHGVPFAKCQKQLAIAMKEPICNYSLEKPVDCFNSHPLSFG